MGFVKALCAILTLKRPWERLKYALRSCLQDPTLYPLGAYPPFDAELCAKMFLRNQTLLHGHAKANGWRALTYLQPFNGVGRRPPTAADSASLAHMRRRVTTDGISELEAMRAFYQRVAADFREGHEKDFHDLTGIFDGDSSHLYIDQVHCSDVGYDVIARRMADDILKLEAGGR